MEDDFQYRILIPNSMLRRGEAATLRWRSWRWRWWRYVDRGMLQEAKMWTENDRKGAPLQLYENNIIWNTTQRKSRTIWEIQWRLRETIKNEELGRLESYRKCIEEKIKLYRQWGSRHQKNTWNAYKLLHF